MKSIATVILIGLASLASAQEPPPAPGRRIDVGGRKLHINCMVPPDPLPAQTGAPFDRLPAETLQLTCSSKRSS